MNDSTKLFTHKNNISSNLLNELACWDSMKNIFGCLFLFLRWEGYPSTSKYKLKIQGGEKKKEKEQETYVCNLFECRFYFYSALLIERCKTLYSYL